MSPVTGEEISAAPSPSELRGWAEDPAASGRVPIHPDTLRAIALELERLQRMERLVRESLR